MFKIASGLSLPEDAVTQTFGLLGRRGSFKTYLSRVASLDLIKRGGGLIAPTSVLFPEGFV